MSWGHSVGWGYLENNLRQLKCQWKCKDRRKDEIIIRLHSLIFHFSIASIYLNLNVKTTLFVLAISVFRSEYFNFAHFLINKTDRSWGSCFTQASFISIIHQYHLSASLIIISIISIIRIFSIILCHSGVILESS